MLQVVTARSKQAQELAILKLYAVLSQAHFVKQQAAEWEGAFLGIMTLGFPLLLKHTAEVVIQQDRGYSTMVGGLLTQASVTTCCYAKLRLLEPLLAKKRKDCAFRRHINEKPITGCPCLARQPDCSHMADTQSLLPHHFIALQVITR